MRSILRLTSIHLPCPLLILLSPYPTFLFWATSSTLKDLTPIYMPTTSSPASSLLSSQNQTHVPIGTQRSFLGYSTDIWPPRVTETERASQHCCSICWPLVPFPLWTPLPVWNPKVFWLLSSLNPCISLVPAHIMISPQTCLLILFSPFHEQCCCANSVSQY